MDICVQTSGLLKDFGPEVAFQKIKDAGFTGVDWGMPFSTGWTSAIAKAGHYKETKFDLPYEELIDLFAPIWDAARKNGIKLSQAHAPYPAYQQKYPDALEYSIGVLKKCVRICAAAGVKHMIVHGNSHWVEDDTQTTKSIQEMNRYMYSCLMEELADCDVIVCMENLFTRHLNNIVVGTCSVPQDAIELIDYCNEKMGKEAFGLCVDTGHLNLLGINQYDYLTAVGKRVKALHIHDNWGNDDHHKIPYSGNIRWQDFLRGLKEIDYDGDLSFETFASIDSDRGIDPFVIDILLNTTYRIGDAFRTQLGK